MVNDLIVFLSNYLNTANKLVSNKPCNVMCIKGCVMVHRGMHGSNYHLLSSCNRKRQKFSLPTLYQTISNKPLFWRFLFFIRLSHRLETIITRTHIEHMYFIHVYQLKNKNVPWCILFHFLQALGWKQL